jgi:hypothetical protein
MVRIKGEIKLSALVLFLHPSSAHPSAWPGSCFFNNQSDNLRIVTRKARKTPKN